jgi:hypothetical protein
MEQETGERLQMEQETAPQHYEKGRADGAIFNFTGYILIFQTLYVVLFRWSRKHVSRSADVCRLLYSY